MERENPSDVALREQREAISVDPLKKRQRFIQGWSLDSGYHPTKHESSTTKFESLTPLSPNHIKVYLQAFTPYDFRDAPLIAVKTLLSFSALSISEDDVFHAMFRYVCATAGVPRSPLAWTSEQRERVHAELHLLLPLIRVFSLSSKVFVHHVEPLQIFNEAELIAKYRFDALQGSDSMPRMTFSRVRGLYPHMEMCRGVFNGLRGRTVVAESSHPYLGGLKEIVKVCTSEWASHMRLEFDRRSTIGQGASLTFYLDEDGSVIIDRWERLWVNKTQGVKVMVCDGCSVFVGLKTTADAKPEWGWKLFATPLIRDDDYGLPSRE